MCAVVNGSGTARRAAAAYANNPKAADAHDFGDGHDGERAKRAGFVARRRVSQPAEEQQTEQ